MLENPAEYDFLRYQGDLRPQHVIMYKDAAVLLLELEMYTDRLVVAEGHEEEKA